MRARERACSTNTIKCTLECLAIRWIPPSLTLAYASKERKTFDCLLARGSIFFAACIFSYYHFILAASFHLAFGWCFPNSYIISTVFHGLFCVPFSAVRRVLVRMLNLCHVFVSNFFDGPRRRRRSRELTRRKRAIDNATRRGVNQFRNSLIAKISKCSAARTFTVHRIVHVTQLFC